MTDIVNPRQAGIITSILIMGSKLLILPSLLFWQVKNGAIFLIVFMFIFEFVMMYFFLKIKQKFHPLSFYQILEISIGKFFAKLIYSLIIIFLFFKFMYTFFESYNFLKELVFEDAEIFLFILCVLPVVSALAYMGLKSYARTVQIFFWFIIFGLIVSTSISYLVDTSSFPVIDFNLNFIPKSFNVIFWFGDFLFLLLFFDKIKPERNYGNIILRYVLITMIIVLCFYFTYYSLFSYTPFLHYFAISDLVQFNVFLGDVWKLDFVALFTIMFLLYFELGFYLYAFCEGLNKIFTPMKKYYSIFIFNFFVLCYVYFARLNLDFIIDNALNYLNVLALICLVAVPLILLVIYFVNRKKYRRKYAKIFKKFNS